MRCPRYMLKLRYTCRTILPHTINTGHILRCLHTMTARLRHILKLKHICRTILPYTKHTGHIMRCLHIMTACLRKMRHTCRTILPHTINTGHILDTDCQSETSILLEHSGAHLETETQLDISHHKGAILLFHSGDLVSLICIKLCLVLVGKSYDWYLKVLCIYILRMLGINRNEKMKGNGVVAKLLFLIGVYEFPL